MNAYILLMMIIAPIGVLSFVFLPTAILLIGGVGVLIGAGVPLLIIYGLAPRLYVYKFRVYENRNQGLYCSEDARGKKVKKDGVEYLETVSGKRYKFSDLSHFVVGKLGNSFGDLFVQSDSADNKEAIPMAIEINKDENKKETALKSFIPENLKVWYSEQGAIGWIKEATKMPIDLKMQVIQTVMMITIVMMAAIIFIFYPMYFDEMDKILKERSAAQLAKLQQQQAAIDKIIDNQPIVCRYEGLPQSIAETNVDKPEPPPA